MMDLNGYVFDKAIDFGEESGICDNCGKTLRYGIWHKHLLTGKRILIGRKCATRTKGIICKNCGTELHKLVKAPQGIRCMFCGKNPTIIEGEKMKVEELTKEECSIVQFMESWMKKP